MDPNCRKTSCANDAAIYCGVIGDGCNRNLDCGQCPEAVVCNADHICVPPATSCTATNPDPLPHAIVFIPNGDLPKLTDGAHCDRCTAMGKDQALANTLTAADGSFTLTGAPAGDAIPIVVLMGGWRRQTTIKVNPCTANVVPDGTIRLPRKKAKAIFR